jgi:Tat protein secretion system quality control protein TatD with DNase activity
MAKDSVRVRVTDPHPIPNPIPNPIRLQSNEPVLVRYTCSTLAGLIGIDPNQLAATTTANAERIFNF